MSCDVMDGMNRKIFVQGDAPQPMPRGRVTGDISRDSEGCISIYLSNYLLEYLLTSLLFYSQSNNKPSFPRSFQNREEIIQRLKKNKKIKKIKEVK